MPDVVADTDSGPKLEIYAEVRHACAASCASMVAFIGAEQFACNINTLRILAADPHFVVRRAVAANLLELCRQLDHHAKVIHPIWNLLLNDPFNDVTCALVPQVGAIIELLTRLGPHSPFAEVRKSRKRLVRTVYLIRDVPIDAGECCGRDLRSCFTLRGTGHELFVVEIASRHVVSIGCITSVSSLQCCSRSADSTLMASHRNFGL